jgi:ABC-type glycerol-3-phosphate transport system permease component
MKGKKLTSYAAITLIVLLALGAIALIVDAVNSSNAAYNEPPFNPFAEDADFERGRRAATSTE